MTTFQFFLPIQLSLGAAVSRAVLYERQNGHSPKNQGHVKQVKGNVKTGERHGDTESEETPRPGKEQQEAVVQRAEEEIWERQEESKQRGGEPGVQGERRDEEGHGCLTPGRSLKTKNKWADVFSI